jgi:hypothetical protein
MDTKTLTDLYVGRHGETVVTVVLDTSGQGEEAAERLAVRWKDVVRELRAAGVDPATLAALDDGFGEAPYNLGDTRALVAADGRLDLATSLPEPPVTEVVRVSPLPSLLPLAEALQNTVPHLLVLTDRQGADILQHTGGSADAQRLTVTTAHYPLHKTGAGGAAALKYEHTVEENWKASEKEVAEAVTHAADAIGAKLLIVAGDVRAEHGLREYLPERLQSLVVIIQGGRGHDGSEPLVARRAQKVIQDYLDGIAADLLTEFAKYRNRATKLAEGERLADAGQPVAAKAADGPWAVSEAFRQAQVGTLLLTDELDGQERAWFGPEPTDIAMREQTLRDLGITRPLSAPLPDVLLRAALGTDADVRKVPYEGEAAPRDGVGALLRYNPVG